MSPSFELEQLADRFERSMLWHVAHARGAVELAEATSAALGLLRLRLAAWQELEAPYEVARTRELIGTPAEHSATTKRRARARCGSYEVEELKAAPE